METIKFKHFALLLYLYVLHSIKNKTTLQALPTKAQHHSHLHTFMIYTLLILVMAQKCHKMASCTYQLTLKSVN